MTILPGAPDPARYRTDGQKQILQQPGRLPAPGSAAMTAPPLKQQADLLSMKGCERSLAKSHGLQLGGPAFGRQFQIFRADQNKLNFFIPIDKLLFGDKI